MLSRNKFGMTSSQNFSSETFAETEELRILSNVKYTQRLLELAIQKNMPSERNLQSSASKIEERIDRKSVTAGSSRASKFRLS